MSRGLPLCLLFLPIALGYFTKDFADYLQNTYGKDTLKQLERRDLFSSGSFGGEHGQRQVANNTVSRFSEAEKDRSFSRSSLSMA